MSKLEKLSAIREQTLEKMIDGYYILNERLEYVYMNASAQRFLTNKEKLLGKRIDDVYPGVFTTSTGKAIQKALKTGKVQQLEMHYSGADMWLLNTIYPLKQGLAIQVHDITIRKNNENNLIFLAKASNILSSSLDYKKTIKSVATLAATSVADWCAVDVLSNKKELESLAVAHKDIKKIKLALQLRKEFPPSDDSPPRRVIKTGVPELIPVISDEMIKSTIKDKKQLSLIQKIGFNSLMVVPLLSKKKPVGTITFVTSETKRHYSATDLAMAEDLANRISLAIENTKLYEEAEDAVRIRNEFISIASHELKTPVTSIKAYEQMLQRKFMREGDSVASESMHKMDDQINKLSILINDLLDVTKIETGKLYLHKDFYEFDELITETVENLQHTTPQKILLSGITGKKVYGDRERTAQVLINLLSNAAKYSDGTGEIHVQVVHGKQDVEVSVRDYGMGIDRQNQHRIFEQFYCASGPKGETFSGLGLGLYISREIIRRQRGKIWVESTPGKGATFSFKLPIFSED